jgi:hypothetical protein
VLTVEPFEWSDLNANGAVEEDELGASFGKKTIVKWKTEGFSLGEITQGALKGFAFKFYGEGITDAKQGKTGIFDFEFDSIGI